MQDAHPPIEPTAGTPDTPGAPEPALVDDDDASVSEQSTLEGEAAALAVFAGVDTAQDDVADPAAAEDDAGELAAAAEDPTAVGQADAPAVAPDAAASPEDSPPVPVAASSAAAVPEAAAAPESAAPEAGAAAESPVQRAVASEAPPEAPAEAEPAIATAPDPEPAPAADDVLPWRASPPAPADPAPTAVPDDAVEAQPPAVAFAPGFLTVDEQGQPVPDEAVEAIERALNRPLPALAAVPLEPADVQSEAEIEAQAALRPNGGALWTLPLICLGIAVIACCLLIPQADENRQLVWEREKLRRDLEQIQKQVEVNDRFLQAMADDAILTQRLVQRQMNVVRAGTAVLELDAAGGDAFASPFQLVNVPPPAPMPRYTPYGGRFAALCRHPKTQLYLIGGALLLIATGLVLGKDPAPRVTPAGA